MVSRPKIADREYYALRTCKTVAAITDWRLSAARYQRLLYLVTVAGWSLYGLDLLPTGWGAGRLHPVSDLIASRLEVFGSGRIWPCREDGETFSAPPWPYSTAKNSVINEILHLYRSPAILRLWKDYLASDRAAWRRCEKDIVRDVYDTEWRRYCTIIRALVR